MEEKKKVRVDWFIADVANIEIDVSPELMGGLIGNAIEYLKVGELTWEKWSLLSEASRAAFVEAKNQLQTRDTLDVPS
jgi:hypothetical protein